MNKDENFPRTILVGLPGNDDSYRRMLALMTRPIEPVILPACLYDPTPIPTPDIDMFNHNPPAIFAPRPDISIERSRSQASRSVLLATVALLSTRNYNEKPSFRITGTAGLKERIKSLEKTLQRNPGRNDIKLQIMELRNQIREIDAQNAKARKAQQQQKGKRSK